MNSNLLPTKQAACNTVDLMKFVLALVVVGIHIHPLPEPYYTYSWGVFGRLAVPFFFIASSYFFFRRSPNTSDLKRYVVRLLKMYLFWFIFTAPLTVMQQFTSPHGDLASKILIFIRNFFFGSTFKGSWFLMALIINIPIVYYLKKINSVYLLILGFLITLILVCDTSFRIFMPHNIDFLFNSLDSFYANDMGTSSHTAFVYIVIGKIIAEKVVEKATTNKPRLTMMMTISLILLYVDATVVMSLSGNNAYLLWQIPVASLLFLVALVNNTNAKMPYKDLRKISIIIYISHFIMQWILDYAGAKGYPYPPTARYLIAVSCCIALGYIIIKLKFPTLRKSQ